MKNFKSGKFKQMKKSISKVSSMILVVALLSSCALSFPRYAQQQTGGTINNNSAQIEALTRDDYKVLRTTRGQASTTRFYFLFIPIGKHKSNDELFENAYYDAVDKLPYADALILPRQKIKKFTIPLLLFNFNKRTTTVSGLGVSVNDKLVEKRDSEVPYRIADNFSLKPTANVKEFKGTKISSQKEFDQYFEKSTVDEADIDFSTHFAIAIVGKESKKIRTIDMNYLKFRGSNIELSYDSEMGDKRENKDQSILILVVDKKYQGEIVRI